jgi:hypothetical protein
LLVLGGLREEEKLFKGKGGGKEGEKGKIKGPREEEEEEEEEGGRSKNLLIKRKIDFEKESEEKIPRSRKEGEEGGRRGRDEK